MQPSLQDPEAKQDAYDNEKHPDLVDENGEVLLADCVVNAALPIVQLDLEHGIERDHKPNCHAELHERAFRVGVENYLPKFPELSEDAVAPVRGLRSGRSWCHGFPAFNSITHRRHFIS